MRHDWKRKLLPHTHRTICTFAPRFADSSASAMPTYMPWVMAFNLDGLLTWIVIRPSDLLIRRSVDVVVDDSSRLIAAYGAGDRWLKVAGDFMPKDAASRRPVAAFTVNIFLFRCNHLMKSSVFAVSRRSWCLIATGCYAKEKGAKWFRMQRMLAICAHIAHQWCDIIFAIFQIRSTACLFEDQKWSLVCIRRMLRWCSEMIMISISIQSRGWDEQP